MIIYSVQRHAWCILGKESSNPQTRGLDDSFFFEFVAPMGGAIENDSLFHGTKLSSHFTFVCLSTNVPPTTLGFFSFLIKCKVIKNFNIIFIFSQSRIFFTFQPCLNKRRSVLPQFRNHCPPRHPCRCRHYCAFWFVCPAIINLEPKRYLGVYPNVGFLYFINVNSLYFSLQKPNAFLICWANLN